MGWRLRIGHHTGFQYAGQVRRVLQRGPADPADAEPGRPRSTPGRGRRRRPRLTRYWDYWGTQVTAFDLHRPHEELEVTGPERRRDARADRAGRQPGWAGTWSTAARCRTGSSSCSRRPAHRRRRRAGGEAAERVGRGAPHEVAPRRVGLGARARRLRARRDRACGRARRRRTTGPGVCQDIAHLTVGDAARDRPAGPVRLRLPAPRSRRRPCAGHRGQSHAWVEWWAGEWSAWDPTNAVPVGPRHVLVGPRPRLRRRPAAQGRLPRLPLHGPHRPRRGRTARLADARYALCRCSRAIPPPHSSTAATARRTASTERSTSLVVGRPVAHRDPQHGAVAPARARTSRRCRRRAAPAVTARVRSSSPKDGAHLGEDARR